MFNVNSNPSLERILETLRRVSSEKNISFDLGIMGSRKAIYAFLPYPLNQELLGKEGRAINESHENYVAKARSNYQSLKVVAAELGLVECPKSERPTQTRVKELFGVGGCCYLFREGKS
jgi:hypothetical protein